MNPDILGSPTGPDGSLEVVFVNDDERVILRVGISEGMSHVDELFLRHLVMLTSDVGVAGVVFVVRRDDGMPKRIDRRLWRELNVRLAHSDTVLHDVVVLGAAVWWSAASGRTCVLRFEDRQTPPARADVEDDPVGGDPREVGLIGHQYSPAEELHAGCRVPQHR